MNDCKRCGKCFRDQYNLSRHQSRTKPCKDKNEVVKNTSIEQSNIFAKQIDTSGTLSSTLNNPNLLINKQKSICCEFCFCEFFNRQCLARHYNSCKLQDDPVRQLEIELEITPEVPENKLECRFCNKVLSRKATLNKHKCKIKEEYHQKLLKQKGKQQVVINNFNNCNINITVINFTSDQNNQDFFMEKAPLQKLLNRANIVHPREPVMAAGDSIAAYLKEMYKIPENRNVITHSKSSTARVCTKEGWVETMKYPIVKKVFNNMCRKISDNCDKTYITEPGEVISVFNDLYHDGLDTDDLSDINKKYCHKALSLQLKNP